MATRRRCGANCVVPRFGASHTRKKLANTHGHKWGWGARRRPAQGRHLELEQEAEHGTSIYG